MFGFMTDQVSLECAAQLIYTRYVYSCFQCNKTKLVKDPKNFIRVILACSLLPPERLGWDPTMRLCRQPINPQSLELIHSYDPCVTLSDYRESLYDIHWVIEMPSKTDINKREQYITVRVLSMAKAECAPGRATIVWAVLKVDDIRTKSSPHHVRLFTIAPAQFLTTFEDICLETVLAAYSRDQRRGFFPT